ncbi:MAG: EthD domain-containing protein, partial [Acidimicrobiia bacterium]
MIDIVFCLKRRPELSAEEFGRYWLEQHAPLVESHAETLGILRYSQHHTIGTPLTDVLRAGRGCAREHFDGMALISFESLDALQAAAATPRGVAAGVELLDDERRF